MFKRPAPVHVSAFILLHHILFFSVCRMPLVIILIVFLKPATHQSATAVTWTSHDQLHRLIIQLGDHFLPSPWVQGTFVECIMHPLGVIYLRHLLCLAVGEGDLLQSFSFTVQAKPFQGCIGGFPMVVFFVVLKIFEIEHFVWNNKQIRDDQQTSAKSQLQNRKIG